MNDRIAELIARYRRDTEKSDQAVIERACEDHPSAADELRRRYANVEAEVPAPTTPTETELPRVGPYQPLEVLGRGGQATVYRAEDTRLGRSVALKVLRGAPNARALARFQREAEVTSRLQDPGICAIYDAGVDGDFAYIAMQYVEGDTLADCIEATRDRGDELLPATRGSATRRARALAPAMDRIVRLVERVARSIDAAHQAGVIHRDLKPGNIMVTPAGDPVVLDFGLAADDNDEAITLTASGDLLGTPAYMSPEQLAADQARVDWRTDVYSLGATLYECLTLRRAFDGPNRDAVFRAIKEREPTSPRRLDRAIPRDLEIVLQTALAKNRDQRYGTALAFARDLRAVREHRPVSARRVGPIGRAWRWSKRRPAAALLVGALGVGGVATTVTGGYLWKMWPSIQQAQTRAERTRSEESFAFGALALLAGDTRAATNAFRAVDAGEDRQTGLAIAAGRAVDAALTDESTSASRLRAALVALVRDGEDSGADTVDLAERARLTASEARPILHFVRGCAYARTGARTEASRTAHALQVLWPESGAAHACAGWLWRGVDDAKSRQAFARARDLGITLPAGSP